MTIALSRARFSHRRRRVGAWRQCRAATAEQAQPNQPPRQPPTRFQSRLHDVAIFLVLSERSLTGLRGAGYRYVAWGTTHMDGGKRVPALAVDCRAGAGPRTRHHCRDLGLEPVMMFSGIYPEAKQRPGSAPPAHLASGAAKVPAGAHLRPHARRQPPALGSSASSKLAPSPGTNGVLLVVKQHGGETGTGAACAKITRESQPRPTSKSITTPGNVHGLPRRQDQPLLTDLAALRQRSAQLLHQGYRMFPTVRTRTAAPGWPRSTTYRCLHQVAFTAARSRCAARNLRPRVPRPTKPDGRRCPGPAGARVFGVGD